VSALIAPSGKPAAIIDAWVDGKFALLTCAAHVNELRATLEKPRVAELVKPHKAGRLVNQVKKLAEDIDPLPRVRRWISPRWSHDFPGGNTTMEHDLMPRNLRIGQQPLFARRRAAQDVLDLCTRTAH